MARRHFDEQIEKYGHKQVLVNLVNKHGYEAPVGDAYCDLVNELEDFRLKYVHFDFHKECSRMRWHRISLLIDEIQDDLEKQGYYHDEVLLSGHVIHSRQEGAVRTNCMDCLDRTNVVQSVIGQWMLERQLHSFGQSIPNEFQPVYRHSNHLY